MPDDFVVAHRSKLVFEGGNRLYRGIVHLAAAQAAHMIVIFCDTVKPSLGSHEFQLSNEAVFA